ncbi:MAG: Bicarbonate transport ATP-binding protein CmpD [Pseudomonadota bacterium]|jgi:NitT/TauT family transport system ATP-binding protein
MTLRINIRKKRFPLARSGEYRIVIRDFTLCLASGTYCCLVGPSGCGKSTLLHMVAGMDRDYEGGIEYPADVETELSSSLSYVFQEPRLLPWRTVLQNISLARVSATRHRYTDEAEMFDLLEFMGLSPVLHEYPGRLSLGMNRRVALVRALVREPRIMLLDEPLASLDAPTARRIRQLLLGAWQKQPHTVLHVTHDLPEALAMADSIVFLERDPMRIMHQLDIDTPRSQREENGWQQAFLADAMVRQPLLRGLL